MRKLLVFLIFLLIVLVVADRGLHYAAENEVANQVSEQYPMTTEPEVTIGGFPFLNQLASGRYSEIHLVTGAFSFSDIELERVDVTLRDVDAPLPELMSDPSIVAGAAEGSVLLPYSELQRQLPEGITVEQEGGTPRLTGDVVIAGQSVPVESDLDLTVQESTVTVTPTNIELGDVPLGAQAVEDMLAFDFPIPALPFDLQITGVEALPNGVEIAAEGNDVVLAGGSAEETAG